MPILKLTPACKDYIWGGNRLASEFGIKADVHPLAEAWVLSCHEAGPSVIENGPWAGTALSAFIREQGAGVLGSGCSRFQDFPILIKLIDAKENLSIQVHPSNEYALAHEGQYGKTEMWYILDAEPGAFLYYGFKKEITAEEFSRAIAENDLVKYLNAVEVHRGDVIFIPAGTLHAICKGILLAEIQQNSNVTYRVYDYGRIGSDGKPRPLHVEQAKAVTALCPPRTSYPFHGHLAQCEYFTADVFQAPLEDVCDQQSFTSLLILEGAGSIRCEAGQLEIKKGDSLFLPAGSGPYQVTGDCRILRTRVGT